MEIMPVKAAQEPQVGIGMSVIDVSVYEGRKPSERSSVKPVKVSAPVWLSGTVKSTYWRILQKPDFSQILPARALTGAKTKSEIPVSSDQEPNKSEPIDPVEATGR